jgi:hypothetical protein
MISITSPFNGGPQTGLTSPTYTLTADTPPNAYSRQWAVTALGGTQTDVSVHQASKPFTITATRPANIRVSPLPNPVTGAMPNSPRNVYVILTRKGAVPGSNQNPQVMLLRTEIGVVAGSDLVDPEDVRAGASAHFGFLWSNSSGIGDTLINNVL